MEHTERAGITNFLATEEVPCGPQASPSCFPQQRTRCTHAAYAPGCLSPCLV